MKRTLALLPALILPFTACGDDATGPADPYALLIEIELREAVIELSEPQPYLCEYKCTGRTQGGEGGEFAVWMEGRLEWMIGDSVASTLQLTEVDLWERFTSPDIGRNQKQDFVRSASSHEPFDLKIVVNARHSSGEILTDSSRVTCTFPEEVMNFSQLAGSWTATMFKWKATETVAGVFDLIQGEGSLSFDLLSDGSLSGTVTLLVGGGSFSTAAVQGSLTIEDAVSVTQANLIFSFTQGPLDNFTGSVFRVGNTLYIEASEGITFDFNRDGIQESATFEAVFELS